MVKIGGQIGRRGYFTPNNDGMVKRASARVEHQVAAGNAHLANALAVDGVRLILWKRQPAGGRVCTCCRPVPLAGSSSPKMAPDDASVAVLGDRLSDGAAFEVLGVSSPSSGLRRKMRAPASPSNANYDNAIGDKELADRKARANGTDYEAAVNLGMADSAGHDTFSEDLAMEPVQEGASIGASLDGFTQNAAQAVGCPVCAGASHVEGWQPHGGRRIVMSFCEEDTWDTVGGELVTSARPNAMRLPVGASLTWVVSAPRLFSEVLRLELRNSRVGAILGENDKLEVFDGASYVEATPKLLKSWAISRPVSNLTFRLVANDREILLTHFEMTVLVADMPFGQFPPLNAPYEHEAEEYLTSISIEVGADLAVNPGDLISDTKYKSMWRVTNAVRRFTANGRAQQLALDLRRVTSTEMFFSMHPFDEYKDHGDLPFSGVNETWQGQGAL